MVTAPIFLPRKFHGQRRLASYSPWGLKETDSTEHAHTHTHTYIGSMQLQVLRNHMSDCLLNFVKKYPGLFCICSFTYCLHIICQSLCYVNHGMMRMNKVWSSSKGMCKEKRK